MTRKRVYDVWIGMKSRVDNPNNPAFKNYGGRGITISERWRSFENFYADMGDPPQAGYSIERKDNDGPYTSDNCEWATRTAQANNTRRNRRIEVRGESLTISQWSRRVGLSPQVISHRLRSGWTPEEILFIPAAPLSQRTHCDKGHELAGNVYTEKTGRVICRTCRLAQVSARPARVTKNGKRFAEYKLEKNDA